MEILVTGASGFLGKHLVRALIKQGHSLVFVNSKESNLCQQSSLNTFNHHRFDQIFHLAAWTQAGDFCLHHPGDQWIINQQMNTNILSWWHQHQPQAKFISIGTSCAYSPELVLSEENYLKGDPIPSLLTYAMTKRMLYLGQLALHQQFNLSYLCLVPSTLYGNGYHTDGRQMHFIFDLIRKILRGKMYGDQVILWGDGSQSREVIHVCDFVKAATFLSENHQNDLINIGSGNEYSIHEYADIICDLVDFNPSNIQYDTSRYVGAKTKCLSTNKLKRLIPNFELTPLIDGIKETVDWFLFNKAEVLQPL